MLPAGHDSGRRAATLSILLVVSCGGPERVSALRPRLVTLSPALTQLAFDLDLGQHIAGVTSFCRLPPGEWRPVIGNALGPRVEPILALRPDRVLIQIDPRHLMALSALRPDLPIEHFRIESLAEVAEALERIGRLAEAPETGKRARATFEALLATTLRRTAGLEPRRLLFVIGFQDPLGAGRGTFIDEMITTAGGRNLLAERHEGWRRQPLEALLALDPELILCQCEQAQAQAAQAYWNGLWARREKTPRVALLLEQEWTVPASHLAAYTARLAELIHPGSTPDAPASEAQ